jgi:hypothetical protein
MDLRLPPTVYSSDINPCLVSSSDISDISDINTGLVIRRVTVITFFV